MLFIGRPPQRDSERPRTSLAVARATGGLTSGGLTSGDLASGGEGSASAAVCGGSGGGFRRSGNGTGARPVSTIIGALDLTATGIVGEGGLGMISRVVADLGGGAKMAALAVPATTRKATANATRLMEEHPVR